MTLLPLFCAALLAAAPKVETKLEQVAPAPAEGKPARTKGQERAVVLVHGFIFHLAEDSVAKPLFRDWQKPGSLLVKNLAKDADVFSFAYGQNASLEEIARQGALAEAVASLKKLGYSDIVLLGHSAGGLLVRQCVEDNPDSGVCKVVQVCAPNTGTPTARAKVHASQQAFLDSLTPEHREKALAARKDKRIPAGVDFICVLGHSDEKFESDGVVPCGCQWPADLRKQGIPVLALAVAHTQATRTAKGAEVLARLVREKQPRWKAGQVEETCRKLFPN